MKYLTLKLTQPMMHGSAVKRLQEFMEHMWFDCGVIDGIYGENTVAVVKKYQLSTRLLIVDGICGPKTWQSILTSLDAFRGRPLATLVDITQEHDHPRGFHRKRTWQEIDGVVLHQTGCNMPQSPERWGKVNAHIGITQEGTAIIINDPTDFIWHAQGLSKRRIGIEIEGNYYGIEGDSKTLWRGGGGPHHLNENMVNALSEVFHWLVGEFDKNGAKWKHIFAHRQSSSSRAADPGQSIWQHIALQWAESLGITAGLGDGYKLGTGRPIPMEWDSASTRAYWEN